jgi:hypothetical protein
MALEHQVMVRLSADLFAKATQLAQAEDRPLSYFIRRAVKQDVEMRWRDGEWPTDSLLDFDEATPPSAGSNTGHGWVRPRPDGYKGALRRSSDLLGMRT